MNLKCIYFFRFILWFNQESYYSLDGKAKRTSKKTKQRLNKIYSKHTGKKIEEIEKIMERDQFFSPEEAIKFGLIDKIVESRKI